MSTESNRKWKRIDMRMKRARQFLDDWKLRNRESLTHDLTVVNNVFFLAAIVHVARTAEERLIVDELCERIARERV